MTLFKLAISSAFVTGALTAGAFITGTALGYCAQKKNIVNKIKKIKSWAITQHNFIRLSFN